MMKQHSLISILVALVFCVMPLWSQAFADCEDIESNPEWLENMAKLEENVAKDDYDEATESARALFRICNKSVRLHTLTGITMMKHGETERAEKYFERAIELVAEREVTVEEATFAWETYYEYGHPESSPKSSDSKKKELDAMQRALNDLHANNELLRSQLVNTGGMDIINNYKAMMWTGVGVGSAGIVMTVVGGVLVGTMDKVNNPGEQVNSGEKVILNNGYVAGWALLGAGIGVTAVGVALAGYGGHGYVNVSKKKDKAANIQWGVGPGSAMITYQF